MANSDRGTALGDELAVFLDALDRTLPQVVRSGLEGASVWPHGMCSVASWIAGDFLRENGLGEWILVNARNDRGGAHDWLEQGGIFYDPTAHQFEGIEHPRRGPTPNPICKDYRNDRREFLATAVGRTTIVAMRDYLTPILRTALADGRRASGSAR